MDEIMPCIYCHCASIGSWEAIFAVELSAKRIENLSKSLRKKCDFENASNKIRADEKRE